MPVRNVDLTNPSEEAQDNYSFFTKQVELSILKTGTGIEIFWRWSDLTQDTLSESTQIALRERSLALWEIGVTVFEKSQILLKFSNE